MTKAPLVVTALFILTGCTTTANLKATPLKEQSAAQIDSDRKRCAEWSKKTTPEVGSTSQTVRLTRASTAIEPTRVLLDVLDCDGQAQREAERDLGMISRWIKENLVYWRTNIDKRRQVFVDCLRPRGYELGKT